MAEKSVQYIGVRKRVWVFGVVVGSASAVLGLLMYYIYWRVFGLVLFGLGIGVVLAFLELLQGCPKFVETDGKVVRLKK